ncbi:MAG: hypothetical protein H0V33_03850, partial [Acidimicrobiia bacterium]|nr:hypothetical protein [Acidimicrobiia bacterium]
IKSIADGLDIGPGVVAGRWQFETKNYTKFNALRRQLPADLFADLA